MKKFLFPEEVYSLGDILKGEGFELYIVGGCVRDILMDKTPRDWDLTTDALPEEIISICEGKGLRCVYENTFGTVLVVFKNENEEVVSEFEITTFRVDGSYVDSRRPEAVSFTRNIHEDLKRRDFTVNALACNVSREIDSKASMRESMIDDHEGASDLLSGTLRTVGDPTERFSEDALRIVRLVRFVSQLDFDVSRETLDAARVLCPSLINVSRERVRDEFIKLVNSKNPKKGLLVSRETGILDLILPELQEGDGIDQSRSHIYDVWTHNVNALQNAASKNWPTHIRLAALFHDVGKPRTRRWDKKQNLYTFYGHEVVGARMTEKIMKRLKFPSRISEDVVRLVRHHMFFSDPDKISHSAVRRLLRVVGSENIWDLMKVRRADRLGMGKKKEDPYRLRYFESMIEEVLRDPVDLKKLKIDGDYMLAALHMKPGRSIGWVLYALLEEVIEDPEINTLKYLSRRAIELYEMPEGDLKKLGESGKKTGKEKDDELILELRKKHKVSW